MRTGRDHLGVPGLVALLLAVAAASGGCAGAERAEPPPQQRLAAAKRNLDSTPGVRIGLSTDALPVGVDGLLHADGVATHAPAFTGAITVATGGVTADAAVVSVGGAVYAKLPFTTRFTRIDPADYGAPDPARLMDPDSGLSSLLTAARGVEERERVRDGKVVLSSFTGTLPGTAVAAVMPSASGRSRFSARFTVSDQDRLAKAVLTGPFYPKADDVTYTVTFRDYGTRRTITAPAPSGPTRR